MDPGCNSDLNDVRNRSNEKIKQVATGSNGFSADSPSAKTPTIHSHVDDIPVCEQCSQNNNNNNNDDDDQEYFNFECSECVALMKDERTTINQLMAIARQWRPDIQNHMPMIIEQMLKKGAHPDDRDQLTDMTLLHFACKSGADGMADPEKSLQIVKYLIETCQADPNLFCRWNDMSALHIAAYFDIAPVLGYLVTVVNPSIIDHPSRYLDSQTPLHIAASNLCLKSARILLSSGANILLKDDFMRTPLDCVPIITDEHTSWYDAETPETSLELRTLLEEATLVVSGESNSPDAECMKTAKVVLSALGLEIGDRIIVGNSKIGTLRYFGPTQFATGIWTGIELDEPMGKNDGSIDGVRYFVCAPNYGIFAPINRISKLDSDEFDLANYHGYDSKQKLLKSNHSPRYNTMNVQSKVDTGLSIMSRNSDANLLSSSRSSVNSEDVALGSRVYLTDKKTGTVRFIGITEFASGIWYGIELTRPLGKNDGSVQGVRYFRCEDKYGVFVQFSRIARVLKSYRNNSSLTSPNNISESEDSDLSMSISGTSSLDLHQLAQNNNNNNNNNNNDNNYHTGNKLYSNRTTRHNDGTFAMRRSISLNRSISLAPRRSGRINSTASEPNTWLRIGVNVLVNGMVGSIRYIGPVHFTEGTFIGIELRAANGKNDGTIDGKRYFQCKPNHGLLVRPKKVTIRGINAAKLLPEDDK